MAPEAIRDIDIRPSLCERIASEVHGRPAVLVPEVTVRWTIPVRLDVLLVSDRLAGYEIKSDVDSLARFSRQVEAYGMVLERATLIVGQRLFEPALAMLPSWWGVTTVKWSRGKLTYRRARKGLLNKEIDALAVAAWLQRSELLVALKALDAGSGASGLDVDHLRQLFVDTYGARGSVAVARRALLQRKSWQRRSVMPLLAESAPKEFQVGVRGEVKKVAAQQE